MGKMKRNLMMVVVIIAVLLLVSCISGENEGDTIPVVKGVRLSELNGYQLDDYREFGLWSLTIDKAELTALEMKTPLTFCVTGEGTETFEISGHKVDHTRYICFIPERVARNAIESGALWSSVQRDEQQETTPNIEKVIIQDDDVQNETDLYEMLLTDYITLKASETSRIYDDGVLIRPSYVKSNEENAYTLQRYYNARQVSENHNVQSALNYLKDRTVPDHNALLFFGNPNRLSVTQGGAEEVTAPDTRERLRQLGVEGEDQTYTFSQDGDKTVFKIWSGKLTNEDWRDAEKFILDITGAVQDCELFPTGEGTLYEGSVTWTLNDELARNARTTALTDFDGGDGTADDPYQIANWKQLNNVRDYMGADVHFMLITDLSSQTAYYETYVATATTPDNAGWQPIGNNTSKFLGTFSGYDGEASHTIADLCVDRSGEDYIGLFGVVGTEATITQLSLKNVDVKGQMFVGGFAGEIDGGTIRDVSVTGSVNGGYSTGGFVGYMGNGSVEKAYATGDVTGTENVGGFAGELNSGTIGNAYATGDVTGDDSVGGFFGYTAGDISISNTYAAGDATGTTYIGGFAGYISNIYSGSITASFWDTETSSCGDSVGTGSDTGITGKTTSEMKTKSTFEDVSWDFIGVWTIVEGNMERSYPYLQSIPQDPAPGYDEIFAGGDGTVNDPYQIGNWKQLNNVRDFMGVDVHFMLTTDLSSQTEHYETYVSTATTAGSAGWDPIGNITTKFLGTFSGYDGEASHTIAELCVDRSGEDYVGLFGYVGTDATITQLSLKNVKLNGKNYVGGFAGRIAGGTIRDMSVTGSVNGTGSVGGFIGSMLDGNISEISVTTHVNGTSNSVGGFIGTIPALNANASSIRNVSVAGSVNGESWNTGGFAGSIYIYENLNVENAYVTSNVTGQTFVGGFAGTIGRGSISNVYATGQVTGDSYVGGFVGKLDVSATITNAYATGDATGTTNMGAFAGSVDPTSNITASFWDTETSGLETGIGDGSATGLTGKTTTEMKTKSTFDSVWNFTDVWAIETEVEDSAISYPYLQSIPQNPAPGHALSP